MISVLAVIGNSGSGKTTTIEYLISNLLKDGFKVGSVKHIHHPDFSINTVGKDTWKHMQAGAMTTVSIAPKEIAIIKKTDTSSYDLGRIISLLDEEKLDIILLEGFHSLVAKREDIAKIITAKDLGDLETTLGGTAPPILAVTGPIAGKKSKMSDLKIPIVNLHNEGSLLLKFVKNYIIKKSSRVQKDITI